MHFEVLVEDRSGSIALEHIFEKILGVKNSVHSWKIHPQKGKQRLLKRLPQLLRGYGKSLQQYGAVVVVVDLDTGNCRAFKQELLSVLEACEPRPKALFRIAIEESEAWLLGDRDAVKAAYPSAKTAVLDGYVQDSLCGTWEVLADAVHPGGSARLKELSYPYTGTAKCEWAEKIAPRMNVDRNRSKSFQAFRDGVRKLSEIG